MLTNTEGFSDDQEKGESFHWRGYQRDQVFEALKVFLALKVLVQLYCYSVTHWNSSGLSMDFADFELIDTC